jgi:hypothetical protein
VRLTWSAATDRDGGHTAPERIDFEARPLGQAMRAAQGKPAWSGGVFRRYAGKLD